MKTRTSIILLVSAFLECNLSTQSDDSSALQAKKSSDGIVYTLSIHKTAFELSDSLQLTFEVRNESNFAKEFGFANQQQFGFQLTDVSGNVALFYPIIVQPAGSGFVLQPSQSKVFSSSWLFKDHAGNLISRGDYRLSAYLTEGRSPEVSLQISVK